MPAQRHRVSGSIKLSRFRFDTLSIPANIRFRAACVFVKDNEVEEQFAVHALLAGGVLGYAAL